MAGEDKTKVQRYDKLDKGYAWIIMIAGTVSNFLQSASYTTLGILYVEYLDHFGESSTKTAWINAVHLACNGLMGEDSRYR